MNLSLGYAFSLKDLFMKFPIKKVSISRHRSQQIFKECVKLIIDDIIENNTIFELPVAGQRADIRIRKVYPEEFKKLRRRGVFKNVDFLKTMFTANLMIMNIRTKGYSREKPIHLDKKRRDRLLELTHQGKSYG